MRLSRLAAGIACICSLLLIACGSDSSAPANIAPNTVTGSVAVGAPMTSGRLRIVDASGALVAGDVVIADDGRYPSVTLSGQAPYRLEACGEHGIEHICLYSVASGPGQANITPLTTAIVLLATGALPATVMAGEVSGLDVLNVQRIQASLQQALAPVLQAAGVPANFDFIRGDLVAGSGTAHDAVLDALNVSTGVDTQPFVQITPRLGNGNIYLEPGSPPVGEVTVPPAAADLSLAGVATLFQNLTAAVSSAEACANPTTGTRALVADNARLSTGGDPLVGRDAVADAICTVFSGQQGGGPQYGWQLTDPTVRRCDLSGAAPLCRVSVLLRTATGDPMTRVENLGTTFVGGAWKLVGQIDAVQINVGTQARRTLRLDDPSATDTYTRQIGFDIPALPGLECARVSQPTLTDSLATLAYYKRFSADSQSHLSVWRIDDQSSVRSLDPAIGATRSGEDLWLPLPEGAEFDQLIRNFQQGGRTVTVKLFSDAACSTPLPVEGQSEYRLDIPQPPAVWAAMGSLPWPELTSDASNALRDLAVPAFTQSSYTAFWTVPQGSTIVEQGVFCINGDCTAGAGSWLGNAQNSPGSTTLTLPLFVNDVPVESMGYKLLGLSGHTTDGLGLDAVWAFCPMSPVGAGC